MLEQRIQQHFYDTADVLVQAAEPLARPLAAATELVLTAVTGGGKLLVAGTGARGWLVQRGLVHQDVAPCSEPRL